MTGARMREEAKRRKKHAERAEEVQVLAVRLAVIEDAFHKVPRVAAKKKMSGYASEDHTRPCMFTPRVTPALAFQRAWYLALWRWLRC